MKYIISIIIPTHNRSQYAISSIKSLLSIDNKGLEIIVSDTSNNKELFEFIESLDKKNSSCHLNYFNPKTPLDMTGNHNAAMSAATGEYVCLIGDDDTVNPEIMNAVSWAKENNIDIIAPNVVSNYAWPDFRSRFFGLGHAGRLYLPSQINTFRWVDGKEALEYGLKNACQGTDNLPKIYHGIVKRSIMEDLRKISGNYFHGSSPDVSGAIGLAIWLTDHKKKFLIVDYPLTIPGASGGSNTGRSAINKHKGKLHQEEQTKAFEKSGWSSGVPRFFSVETVWAHAAIETINKLKPEYLSHFNFPRLLAACQSLHSEYKIEIENEIVISAKINQDPVNSTLKKITSEKLHLSVKKLFYILKRSIHPTASGGRKFAKNISNIEEAQIALKINLEANNIQWSSFKKNIIIDQ
ncbi:glycosyltransferase family 2 protein [Thiothrix unzii]|jgi:glycosyltransferase involved in cell wall biosynthesis|uniref:glycosyltransferase family 2 protein n=1 Tax=Thiothrix unzii TaxID=111769 RepID=UPI002A35CAAF|nr:glycosyltransferase family 2 protein [Thiothrix unzii]MDX9988230.1 glycosyltransferase family 2 protein [Thiothrix unzii]